MGIGTKLIGVLIILMAILGSSAIIAQDTAGSSALRPADYKPKIGHLVAGSKNFRKSTLTFNSIGKDHEHS